MRCEAIWCHSGNSFGVWFFVYEMDTKHCIREISHRRRGEEEKPSGRRRKSLLSAESIAPSGFGGTFTESVFMATAVFAGAHHADYVLADVRRDKTGSSSEASYRKFEQRYQEIGLKAGDKNFSAKIYFQCLHRYRQHFFVCKTSFACLIDKSFGTLDAFNNCALAMTTCAVSCLL